jgi:hypothetical protein
VDNRRTAMPVDEEDRGYVSHPILMKAPALAMKAVVAVHCIMSTDSDQWLKRPSVQRLAICMRAVPGLALSQGEIHTMNANNPVRILSI